MKSSSSSSNLSRPLSRSNQGTPKNRSRSKPQDYDVFLLTPELDLESVIQSKKKTLDLLNYQTETLDKEIQDQLLVRDKQISDLNRQILDLKSSFKTRDSNKGEKNLEQELENQGKSLSELRKENQDLQERLQNVEHDYSRAKRKWEDERENLEILNNALEEEGFGHDQAIEAKVQELGELETGLNTLQTAVEKYSRLNSDLLGNIDKGNSEIKNLNLRVFESSLRVAKVSELERVVQELMAQNYEKDVKNVRLTMYPDLLSRYLKVTDWVVQNLANIEEHARIREGVIAEINEDNIKQGIKELKTFLEDTGSNVGTIRSSLLNSHPNINSEDLSTDEQLRQKNSELEKELSELRKHENNIKEKEQEYSDTINKLQASLEHCSLDYQGNLAKMKNQIDQMKETEEKTSEKTAKLTAEYEKNLSEVYVMKMKIANISKRQDYFNKKRKEYQETEEKLRNENVSLKQRLVLNPGRTSLRKNSNDESKVKKALTQLQILRDELFRKDTELVKKAREMIKLEKLMEKEKNVTQKLHDKMKNIEAEIISKVSVEIEEKDRQIEILKEMLRCAHSDIKSKDSHLNSIKGGERMTSPKRK